MEKSAELAEGDLDRRRFWFGVSGSELVEEKRGGERRNGRNSKVKE